MTEIEYTVTLNQKQAKQEMGPTIGKRYYEPTSINAIVTVAKNPVTAQCGTKGAVSQKFKINFVGKKQDAAGNDFQVQKNSGNPGYLDGYPLKIAFS